MEINSNIKNLPVVFLIVVQSGCGIQPNTETGSSQRKNTVSKINTPAVREFGSVTENQKKEIRALIEQLVISKEKANNKPFRNPMMKIYNAEGKEVKPKGGSKKNDEFRKRYKLCQEAFQKLYELKAPAVTILLDHLDDERQSINFRNHYSANSVGDACYWNIYYQLVDKPEDYSEYGHSRVGRDGKNYPKPYWEGTPFDDAGGLKKWFTENKKLNYTEMQIKCLEWLLEKEKHIGASDADSYFLNILPLEIRILERRLENGDKVKLELDRLRKVRDKKITNEIPKELLPSG